MKILVIAWQAVRGYVRDRVLHSVLLFSVLFVLFSFFLSSLTIVESRKILLDFGLSAISLMGVVLALFLGVTVIGTEMEKRTIYTVLSKPVRRSEYVLGKYLGAALISGLVHLLNLATLLLVLLYLGEGFPPGLAAAVFLMILESLIVLAVALFWSLVTSSLFLAASLTLALFLIGRSSLSLRVISEKTEQPVLKAILRFFYDLFPALDRFNIRELVAYGKPYPEGMVATSSLYFLAYVILVLSISILVIRRKDFS